MTYRSRQLLNLARGQSCVMCGADDGTVVSAHSNLGEHGKGKSLKAADCCAAWLCFRCHTEVDQGRTMSRAERRDFMLTAIVRTHSKMFELGFLTVNGG